MNKANEVIILFEVEKRQPRDIKHFKGVFSREDALRTGFKTLTEDDYGKELYDELITNYSVNVAGINFIIEKHKVNGIIE